MPAQQKALNQDLSWQTRQQQLHKVTHWQLNGAIAIKTPRQGQTASIVWQQYQAQHYQIDLFGPLGVGHLILKGNTGQVTLNTNGQQYQSATAEELMQKILGWHVPVSNLYFWIRGLPAPHLKSHLSFDMYHHLAILRQQGWQIHYRQYTAINGIDLPSKLILQQQNMIIKFIISHWQLINNE